MEPSVVSHYRLLDRLGEGGMGVVYRAHDLRLGREVAIKLLRKDASTTADWRARFEREARLASALQHPHICTIHELGEHNGQPFIVMERLEGRTVRQLIEAGPLQIHRVLDLARQIADALDGAHRRGIIHRDIKPANLFVTYGDHLKVLDFGLAKTTATDPPTATAPVVRTSSPTMAGVAAADLTATGVALGTAAYMSPEQAHGQTLDARSDLFSVGSVLYEMATGRRAFGGDDLGMIAMRIVNGILIPPRTVNPEIPEDVEAIILKLMATDPDARYQTAAELLKDVRAALMRIDPISSIGRIVPARTQGPTNLRTHGPTRRRIWMTVAASAAGVAIAAAVTYTWLMPRPPALTDRDSILISTFDNTTGDVVFDESLLTALKAQLGQSPFLDIVPDSRVREELRLMGRSADEPLTTALTREVCQRLGLKAMLDGSIAPLGTNYVLRLEATDCQTGEPLAREQAEAPKQQVLNELGSMSSRMRTRLGESLPSIQRFDVPIEQATTPSLPALKAYALGLEERRRGRELESIAFFNQAIDLDREFAAAYATLSTVYGSVGEWRRSEEYARLAYGLQKRVSERERLFIDYQFHDRVTGNQDKAAATLERWKTAYPRESRPANALAVIHNRVGRYERAVEEAQEALRRSPGHPFPLSNLSIAYRALGRYADARQTGEEAVKLGVETTPTRRLLYQIGVLTGDGSAATHLAWAKDRPREFDLVSAQAQVAAYEGRAKDAGEWFRRASEMAIARNLRGTASGYAAQLAWTEALYRTGADATARVRRTLTSNDSDTDGPGTIPRFRAAAALAITGLGAEAIPIVAQGEQRYPESTFVRTVLRPVTRAAIALRQQKPDEAIEILRAAEPTELGTVAALVPPYLRGEAFLQRSAYVEAIREYRKVLQHRGVDPFAPTVPLSQLGVARAYARNGDVGNSRRAYEELFNIWKNADADFAPLRAARAEYARLVGGTTRP
jgi:serine/threonine protein kinase/tetratricopeptide (TPR) repeat protein